MFFFNVHMEPRSARPSLLQTAVNVVTTAMNAVSLLWSLTNPINAMVAMNRMQWNIARAWNLA